MAEENDTATGTGSSFSWALDALRRGKKLARLGWNGQGMFVVRQKGYPDGIEINKNTAEALGIPVGEVRRFLPYFMFCNVQGEFVPWLASQTDLLSEDWILVDSASGSAD